MKNAQVCPVCGGKGIVPNGFYLVGVNNYSTTSTTPERCRSCNGLGYILIEDYLSNPVSFNMSCSICENNDGFCYMSNPCKYKCKLDNEYYLSDHFCKKFKMKG